MYRIPFIVRKRSISSPLLRSGLGNRVIPIGCTLNLAAELNYRPVIFWEYAETVGGAKFKDLFDDTNLPFELVEGYEARVMAVTLFHKRPVLSSLHKRVIIKLTNLLVMNQYDKRIRLVPNMNQYDKRGWRGDVEGCDQFKERSITDLLKYSKIMVGGNLMFRHGYDLSWLKPAPQIAPHITELKKQFAPNTVGVHIRGTDWIYIPPIEKIITRMHAEVELDPNVKFFLASDGDKNVGKIVDTFGDRLIMYKNTCSSERRTLQGNQDAVVDLFGLATTSRIIGFGYSTFANLAAMIGNKPILKLTAAGTYL